MIIIILYLLVFQGFAPPISRLVPISLGYSASITATGQNLVDGGGNGNIDFGI